MNRKPLITNPSLSAVAAVFVIVGALVYISERPVRSNFTPIPYPKTNEAPSTLPAETVLAPTIEEPAPTQPTTGGIGDVVSQILKSLTGQADLTGVLSSDLTVTYSSAEIKTALEIALSKYGAVQSLWTTGDPNITGDYADQGIEITTSQGKYRYQLFLHRENGDWKLMGTEPLP